VTECTLNRMCFQCALKCAFNIELIFSTYRESRKTHTLQPKVSSCVVVQAFTCQHSVYVYCILIAVVSSKYEQITDPFFTFLILKGPTLLTLNDMWRMVWEQHSYTIVMVTSLVELLKVSMFLLPFLSILYSIGTISILHYCMYNLL
jgi:hypothetical protein